MPMYGFSRDGTFKLIKTNEQGFTAELQLNAIARQAYPFQYSFSGHDVFQLDSFKVEFELKTYTINPSLRSPDITSISNYHGMQRRHARTTNYKSQRLRPSLKLPTAHGKPSPTFSRRAALLIQT
ncbi:MAG: hypothetical protein ACI81V_000809 [Lentimonas sp.]|jgi:hypothetical protein